MKDQNYAAMSEHAHVDGVYPFPAVMQTRRIETNGASIHVRVGGHGPAVVMLHGFGTTGDMWGHLASALIEDHTVVSPDLRGLGLSSKPDGGYEQKHQAADLMGVLDALRVRTGAMRAGFAGFLTFGQDAAGNRTSLARGKPQMPVLGFGGEATFGPMIGAVMRCVADNVEDVIIPDCGHWITEEQPQATTDLVVDFLHRR